MEKKKQKKSVTDWTTLKSKPLKSHSVWLSANPEVMWLHATFFLQTTTLFVSTKSWLFLSSLCIMRTSWIKTLRLVKKHGKLVRLWCQSSTLFQQCFSTNQFSIVQQTIFPLFNMHLRPLSNNLKNPLILKWPLNPEHKEKNPHKYAPVERKSSFSFEYYWSHSSHLLNIY